MIAMNFPFKKESGMSRTELHYWNIEHAAKEFAQNFVFGQQTTKSKTPGKTWYNHDLQCAFWEDYNETGIDLKYLLIGNSAQRNIENSPGEFGEGMKKALLIAEREGCFARIETIGFSVTGSFEIGSLGAEEFIFTITGNNRKLGSKFTLQCDEETYLKANSFFGYISNPDQQNMFLENNILDFISDDNKLYLNGVYINSPQNLLASYNIVGKELNVRDRDKFDSYKLNMILWEKIIGQTKNINLITKIVQNINESCLETYYIRYGKIAEENIKYWKKAIYNLYGSKVCFSSTPFCDKEMSYRGYTIVNLYDSWAKELFEKLEITSSLQLVNKAGQKVIGDKIKLKELTSKEKNNLKQAISIIKEYYCNYLYNIKVMSDLQDNNGTKVNGLCDHDNKTIFLNRDIIENFGYMFQTLVHEAVHQRSNAEDCSPEFEKEFAYACLLFVKGIKKSNNLEELPDEEDF
jgi:hypothetical protein